MASEPDFTNVHRIHEDRIANVLDGLKGGDGGGTFDGMEQRVIKLEEKADTIVASLAEVRERLVAVEVKVDHLPTKDWITARMQLYAALSVAAIAVVTNIDKLI